MKFRITGKVLTIGDLIEMESGRMSVMRDIMAKCLVGEDDQHLPFPEAVKQINAIPLDELPEISEQFKNALEAYKGGAIPPTGGGK